MLALKLTPKAVLALFKEMDTNENGTIDYYEFKAVADELGINIPAAKMKDVFTALDHSQDGEIQTTDLMRDIFGGSGEAMKEDAVRQGSEFKSLAQEVEAKWRKSESTESLGGKSQALERQDMGSLVLRATAAAKVTGSMPSSTKKVMDDCNSPAWHNIREKLERRRAIMQRLQAFHKDVGTLIDLAKELREGSDKMASTIHRVAGKGVLLRARRRALQKRNSAVDSRMRSSSSAVEETDSGALGMGYLPGIYGEAQPEKQKTKAEEKSVFGSVLDRLGTFISPSDSDEENEEGGDEDAQAQMGKATRLASDLDAWSTSSTKDKPEESEDGSSSDDTSESGSSSSNSGSSSSEGEEEEGMQGVHAVTEKEPFWDWLYGPTEQPDDEVDETEDISQDIAAPRDSKRHAKDANFRSDEEVNEDGVCSRYGHSRVQRKARTCHMNRVCAGPGFAFMDWFKLQDLDSSWT